MLINMFRCSTVLGFSLFLLTGCNQPQRVEMQPLDPTASAKKAIATYDKNDDQQLDADECSPAFAALLLTADKNNDKLLDEQEIKERLEYHESRQVGLISASFNLNSRGNPAKKVDLQLVPDSIFQHLKNASGTTDDYGHVAFTTDGETLPGVYPGLYNIVAMTNGEPKTLSTGFEAGQGITRGERTIDLKYQ